LTLCSYLLCDDFDLMVPDWETMHKVLREGVTPARPAPIPPAALPTELGYQEMQALLLMPAAQARE
jgi:hypothetical protein